MLNRSRRFFFLLLCAAALLSQGFYVAEVCPADTASALAMRIRDRARQQIDADDRPPGYLDASHNMSNGCGVSGVPSFPRRGG